MLAQLKTAPRVLLRWLAPDHCAACDVELSETALWARHNGVRAHSTCTAGLFCADCAGQFVQTERRRGQAAPNIQSANLHVLGLYDGPLKQAIIRFKYQRQPGLAPALASALYKSLPPASCLGAEQNAACASSVTLIPVPIHPLRLVERGYNQAALLAVELAHAAGVRHDTRALRRVRHTPRQAQLDRAERLQNMHQQIAVRRLPLGPVVLVDDVFTTGSTARACIECIRAAGGNISHVLALGLTL